MASSEMGGRVVVHVVLLALLTLLADVKTFLWFERGLLWLDTDPDALYGSVHILPVALKFVGTAECDGAAGTWQWGLCLVVRW